MAILTHRFVSAVADGPYPTQVNPSNWNEPHSFTGGNNGSLLVRSTSAASSSEGIVWLNPSSVAQAILLNGGSSSQPVWSTYAVPTALTTGDLLAASSSLTLSNLAAAAAGSVLVSAGTGVLPAWSSSLSITNLALTGTLTKVNNVSTAGNGATIPVAQVIAVTQGADIATTNLLASAPAGLYRVSSWCAVTRAATTNSVLPAVKVVTSNGVTQTITVAATTSGNTTTTLTQGAVVVRASSSSPNITYTSSGFATSGATSMQYELYLTLEMLSSS